MNEDAFFVIFCAVMISFTFFATWIIASFVMMLTGVSVSSKKIMHRFFRKLYFWFFVFVVILFNIAS